MQIQAGEKKTDFVEWVFSSPQEEGRSKYKFYLTRKEKETFIPKSKEEKQRVNLSSFYVILLHKELRHLIDKKEEKVGGKFK